MMMPIVGLTDRVAPAFPRLGKLRKGGARPVSGERPGTELPYWRFVAENPLVLQAFEAAYGKEPTELDVLLPYASIAGNYEAWQEEWVAGGLKHRCDGETCVLWLADDGTYSQRPVPCPGGCKPVGRLNVILPALLRAGHVGYVTMETHSINDIADLQGTLLAVAEARGTEDMRGIGFCLRRVERQISTPSGKDGKRARRTKYMVELIPAARWVVAQLEARQDAAMNALPAPSVPVLEDAPEDDDADDGETIEGQVTHVEQGEAEDDAPPQAPVARPWPAERIREAIVEKTRRLGDDEAASREFKGFTNGALTDLFGDRHLAERNAMRKSVLMYVFGVDTSDALTKGQCKALCAWARDEGDEGASAPNQYAISEAVAMVAAYEESKGQGTLAI
jgi:hypothetical protein